MPLAPTYLHPMLQLVAACCSAVQCVAAHPHLIPPLLASFVYVSVYVCVCVCVYVCVREFVYVCVRECFCVRVGPPRVWFEVCVSLCTPPPPPLSLPLPLLCGWGWFFPFPPPPPLLSLSPPPVCVGGSR